MGIIAQKIIYITENVKNDIIVSIAHIMRINVGSTLKYSANPPHTPAKILLFLERHNFLFI